MSATMTITDAAKAQIRARSYAARFRAETPEGERHPEPTDEEMARRFAGCVRVPRAEEYPAIREAIANWPETDRNLSAVEAQPSGQATTSGELPRDVLHEITSTPIAGVAYVVRIDTELKVYVHHGDQWNYSGRLDCTPGADSLQLIADHFAGQLATNRRIERGWRGEITPERVAADRDVALTLNGGE